MSFVAANLPPSAYALFQQAQKAPPLWPSVVKESYRVGIHDLNKLTDVAFHVHHPERKGRDIASGESLLIKEWKGYKETIRSWMPASKSTSSKSTSSKPPSAEPTSSKPSGPSLLELLREVDTWSLGRSLEQTLHLYRFKEFLIRALDCKVVDDSYYQFSYFDAMGRERSCSEKHSVSSVNRGTRMQYAARNFQRVAEDCTTVGEVAKRLVQIESIVACHTFVLVRWAHQSAGTGDGSLSAYTEMKYLRELVSLARRSYPESIYSVYKESLEMTLSNAG
ncbi:MAG: hypothetical protein R2748_30155 [Bryobacterales bacterium]